MGRIMGTFYAGDGIIRSRDMEWIQGYINVLTGLFRRVDLMANITKSKIKTCQTGVIHTWMSEEAFSQRSTGEGATYR